VFAALLETEVALRKLWQEKACGTLYFHTFIVRAEVFDLWMGGGVAVLWVGGGVGVYMRCTWYRRAWQLFGLLLKNIRVCL